MIVVIKDHQGILEYMKQHHDNDWSYGYGNDKTKIRIELNEDVAINILKELQTSQPLEIIRDLETEPTQDQKFESILIATAEYIANSSMNNTVIAGINKSISALDKKTQGAFIEHCIVGNLESEDGYYNLACMHCISIALSMLTQ